MTRIAIAQTTTGIDPDANTRTLVAAIEEARRGGAEMLFTPEMSGLLDRDRDRACSKIATEADDAVLGAVRQAARREGLWVHLGSLAVAPGDAGGRLANRAFVIDDGGAVRATYDKIHLFDVDLPSGERWRESAVYAPGTRVVIAATPAGTLGLSICYDLRFPALYAAVSAAGAQILAVPAAFTVPTGRAHWHTLLKARAIENAAFVIAAAQTGEHEDGRKTYGHSLVVDPWGEVLLDMGDAPGVGFCDIDLDKAAEARSRIDVVNHRRMIPEVKRR